MKYLKMTIITLFIFTIISCASSYDKQVNTDQKQYTTLKQIISKKYILDNIYKEYKISIEFDDTKVNGYGCVNSYFGKFDLHNGNLSIPELSTTRIMGTPEAMEAERNYYNMLMNAEKLQADKNKLIITLKNGQQLIYKEAI